MNILQRIENIVKEADTYLTDVEILVKVFDLEEYITISLFKIFFDCLDVLEGTGKIITESDTVTRERRVYWVGVDNPKLEKLLSESVCI